MDKWIAAIIAVAFVAIGMLMTLYGDRFGRWWGGLGFHIFRIAPWLNISGKTREQAEHEFYDSPPLKYFWLFWVWGMRVFGVLAVVMGLLLFFLLVLQR